MGLGAKITKTGPTALHELVLSLAFGDHRRCNRSAVLLLQVCRHDASKVQRAGIDRKAQKVPFSLDVEVT